MYPQEILNKFRALAPLRVLFTNPRSNERFPGNHVDRVGVRALYFAGLNEINKPLIFLSSAKVQLAPVPNLYTRRRVFREVLNFHSSIFPRR